MKNDFQIFYRKENRYLFEKRIKMSLSCKAILKSGARIGQPCGARLKSKSDRDALDVFCGRHQKNVHVDKNTMRELLGMQTVEEVKVEEPVIESYVSEPPTIVIEPVEEPIGCRAILKSGSRAGHPCGARLEVESNISIGLCGRHLKYENCPEKMPLQRRPRKKPEPESQPEPEPEPVGGVVGEPRFLCDEFCSKTIPLFEYQKEAIEKMENIEKTKTIKTTYNELNGSEVEITTDFAIFANEIGSGKTLTTLGLIARDKLKIEDSSTERYLHVPMRTDDISFSIKLSKKYEKVIDSTLVVSSNAVIAHWEKELEKTTLSSFVIGTRADIATSKLMNLTRHKCDVILCTATMFKDFCGVYGDAFWKRVIIDEADSIDAPGMSRISAGFTWLITATPKHLGRSQKRSWFAMTFFNYQSANLRKWLTVKTEARMNLDEPTVHNHRYMVNRIAEAIAPHVDASVIAMIEAGNVEEAVKKLGGESSSESLVDLVCGKYQKSLKDAKRQLSLKVNPENERLREHETKWNGRIAELETKIADLTARVGNSVSEAECIVCRDTVTAPVLVTCCQHLMCAECIVRWMQRNPSCPLCRVKAGDFALIHLTQSKKEADKKQEKENKSEARPKQEIIAEIVKENPRAKVLIFSEHDATWKTVAKYLDDAAIKYATFNGSKVTKAKRLREFEAGAFPVMFINSRANGAGIHLPYVSDVIIYHDMPQDITNQAIGRGQRLGRTSRLNIHYFKN